MSPTGIVTAHFSYVKFFEMIRVHVIYLSVIRTDGGNVSGLGFKVVLTAFRSGKVFIDSNDRYRH